MILKAPRPRRGETACVWIDFRKEDTMTSLRNVVALWAMVVLLSVSGWAQSAASAEMLVTVRDPNGAIVKNATVTAQNLAQHFSRTAAANVNGQYQFLLLPPGAYTVTVEAPGFARVVASNVTITVGQRAALPVD